MLCTSRQALQYNLDTSILSSSLIKVGHSSTTLVWNGAGFLRHSGKFTLWPRCADYANIPQPAGACTYTHACIHLIYLWRHVGQVPSLIPQNSSNEGVCVRAHSFELFAVFTHNSSIVKHHTSGELGNSEHQDELVMSLSHNRGKKLCNTCVTVLLDNNRSKPGAGWSTSKQHLSGGRSTVSTEASEQCCWLVSDSGLIYFTAPDSLQRQII